MHCCDLNEKFKELFNSWMMDRGDWVLSSFQQCFSKIKSMIE